MVIVFFDGHCFVWWSIEMSECCLMVIGIGMHCLMIIGMMGTHCLMVIEMGTCWLISIRSCAFVDMKISSVLLTRTVCHLPVNSKLVFWRPLEWEIEHSEMVPISLTHKVSAINMSDLVCGHTCHFQIKSGVLACFGVRVHCPSCAVWGNKWSCQCTWYLALAFVCHSLGCWWCWLERQVSNKWPWVVVPVFKDREYEHSPQLALFGRIQTISWVWSIWGIPPMKNLSHWCQWKWKCHQIQNNQCQGVSLLMGKVSRDGIWLSDVHV